MRRPVLAEVVEPDDVVTGVEQLGHEVAVDEPGGPGDEDAHHELDAPALAPQTSTTSLPPTLEAAVHLVWRPEDEDVALAEDAFERHEPVVLDVRVGARTRAPAHDRSLRSL